jgi:hypothetical protein
VANISLLRAGSQLVRIRLVETIFLNLFWEKSFPAFVLINTVMMKMDICQESL